MSDAKALHDAAFAGNTALVKKILQALRDGGGGRAVIRACEHLNKDYTEHGWTALYAAVSNDHNEVVELLMEAHPTAAHIPTDRRTLPIHLCAWHRRGALARVLLEGATDGGAKQVAAHDEDGSTALTIACERGATACVEALIDHGASVAAVNGDGWSPLECLEYNKDSIPEAAFIKINAILGNVASGPALLEAAAHADLAEVKRQLELARDAGGLEAAVELCAHRDQDGRTPLFRACEAHMDDVTRSKAHKLAAAGGAGGAGGGEDADEEEDEAREECVRTLLQVSTTEVHIPDARGWLPAHAAAAVDSVGALRLVLGRSPTGDRGHTQFLHKALNGDTILHIAADAGALESIKLLCRKKIVAKIVNSHNNESLSAMHIAVRHRRPEVKRVVVEQLRHAGAKGVVEPGPGEPGATEPDIHGAVAADSGSAAATRAAIQEAVRHGGKRAAEHLCRVLDDRGQTPCFVACGLGREAVLAALFEISVHEASVARADGRRPLHAAAGAANDTGVGCIKALLAALPGKSERDAQIAAVDDSKWTPLHVACEQGNVKAATLLLENGAETSYERSWSLTPVHVACEAGQAVILDVLLKFGADPTVPDKRSRTPLSVIHANAAKLEDEVVTAMLSSLAKSIGPGEAGAKPVRGRAGKWAVTGEQLYDTVAGGNGPGVRRMLASARAHGGTETVRRICSYRHHEDGATPLMLAARNGFADGLLALLQASPDEVMTKDDMMCIPAHIVAREGNVDMLEALLSSQRGKEQANCTNDVGSTPLFSAIRGGNLECVRLLLKVGADTTIQLRAGVSPVVFAREWLGRTFEMRAKEQLRAIIDLIEGSGEFDAAWDAVSDDEDVGGGSSGMAIATSTGDSGSSDVPQLRNVAAYAMVANCVWKDAFDVGRADRDAATTQLARVLYAMRLMRHCRPTSSLIPRPFSSGQALRHAGVVWHGNGGLIAALRRWLPVAAAVSGGTISKRALADILGDDFSILHLRREHSLAHPAYAIVRDKRARTVALVVHGSNALDRNVFNEIIAPPTSFFGGFCSTSLAASAASVLADCRRPLETALTVHKDDMLVVTGYSIGAAEAALLTVTLLEDHVAGRHSMVPAAGMRCFAYAPPPCITPDVSARARNHITTVAVRSDVVQRLSHAWIKTSLGVLESLTDSEQFKERLAVRAEFAACLEKLRRVRGSVEGRRGSDSMLPRDAASQRLLDLTPWQSELVPPGRLFTLSSDNVRPAPGAHPVPVMTLVEVDAETLSTPTDPRRFLSRLVGLAKACLLATRASSLRMFDDHTAESLNAALAATAVAVDEYHGRAKPSGSPNPWQKSGGRSTVGAATAAATWLSKTKRSKGGGRDPSTASLSPALAPLANLSGDMSDKRRTAKPGQQSRGMSHRKLGKTGQQSRGMSQRKLSKPGQQSRGMSHRKLGKTRDKHSSSRF